MPLSPDYGIEPDTSGGRFLIAVGMAVYDCHPDVENLDRVPEAVQRVVSMFTARGYRHVLPELGDSPGAPLLQTSLSEWFRAPARQPRDTVVLYHTGHGAVEGGCHYLLTRDSPATGFAMQPVVRTEDLGRLFADSRAHQILLILDTCHAGAGASELTRVVDKLIKVPRQERSGVHVLASAFPKQVAKQGLFVQVFEDALTRESSMSAPWVSLEELCERMNQILADELKQSQSVGHGKPFGAGVGRFLPNLRYRPELRGADLETQRRLATLTPEEYESHFGPKGRGVEHPGEPGGYFIGRRRALSRIAGWLGGQPPSLKLLVLTGSPGSGKSAVIGRTIALSDIAFRHERAGGDVPAETIPPQGSIDAVVSARNKRYIEMIATIGRKAGIAALGEADALVKELGALGRRFTLVVDALDEAVQEDIVRIARLLRMLADTGNAAVLVGTRKGQAAPRGQIARTDPLMRALGVEAEEVLDLDSDEYFNIAEIADYVKARLLAENEPQVETAYRGRPDLADKLAAAVASKAAPSFLVATIASRALRDAPQPVDTSKPDWQRRYSLPIRVADAMALYLERFAAPERARLESLLAPLAWAQGAGLPRLRVWPGLAGTLAGTGASYTDRDVAWALQAAGAFIVEDLDEERPVYRLFHAELAEVVCGAREAEDAHRQIVDGLLERLSPVGDWFSADWYARKYLAAHARLAGRLDEFLVQAGFLAAADPEELLAVLPAARSRPARTAARAYRQSVHRVQAADGSVEEAASYLELALREAGSELQDGVAELPLGRPWSIPWVRLARFGSHQVLEGHESGVTAVEVRTIRGGQVIASASTDGTIRLWRLDTGAPVAGPITGHDGAIRAMTVAEPPGRTILVTGGDDATVRRWDADSGTPIGELFVGHTSVVTALAIATRKGRPFLVSADESRTLRCWDLETGSCLAEIVTDHRGPVGAVAVTEQAGRTVLITGGQDWTVRLWDAETGALVGGPFQRTTFPSPVRQVLAGRFGGRNLMFVMEISTGWIVDLDTKQMVGDVPPGVLAIGELEGQPVLVAALWTVDEIRLNNLVTGEELGRLSTGRGGIDAVQLAERDGSPVVVAGCRDGTVRIWDWNVVPSGGDSGTESAAIWAVAIAERAGRQFVVSGGETLKLLDLETGDPVGRPFIGHSSWVTALAASERGGQIVIVSGSNDCNVMKWDIDGARLGQPMRHTAPIGAVSILEVAGNGVIIAGTQNAGLLLWDLDTCEQIGQLFQGDTTSQWIADLWVGELNGSPIVVAGLHDHTIRIWGLASLVPVGKPLQGHTDWVAAVTGGTFDGQLIVVSGGWDRTLRLWDITSGEEVGEPLPHRNRVQAVALATLDSRQVIVSADTAGQIAVWDLASRRPILKIELDKLVRALALCGRRMVVGTDAGLIAIDLGDLA